MITNIKDNVTCVNADCFDYFPNIKDNSVDMILCDLHFGNSTTFFYKKPFFFKKINYICKKNYTNKWIKILKINVIIKYAFGMILTTPQY